MIGVLEVIFIILIACVIWFVVFTAMIKYKQKKFFKDLLKNIDNQDKVIFNGGLDKKFDLRKELEEEKLINSPTSSEEEAEVNEPAQDGEDFSGSDVPLASPSGDAKISLFEKLKKILRLKK